MGLLEKVLKSTVFVTTSSYITLITSLLGFLILVLIVSPEEYGSYVLAISFVYAATGLIGFGAAPLVISELTQKLENEDLSFVYNFIKSHIKVNISSSVVLAALFLSSPTLFPEQLGGISNLMFVSGAMIVSEVVRRIVGQIFLIQAKFEEKSFLDITNSILRLIILTILVYFYNFGAFGGIASFVIAGVVSSFLSLRGIMEFFKKVSKYGDDGKSMYWEIMLKRGKYLAISSQLKNLSDQAPIWLIAYYFGTVEVAMFSVALKIMDPIKLFLSSLEIVSLPMINQAIVKSKEQASRLYFSFSKMGLYLALSSGTVAYFLIPFAIELIFPGEYTESIPLFKLMLPLLALVGLGVSQRSLLNSLGMQKTFVKDYFLSLAIFILSFMVLAPTFGIYGVAISFVMQRMVVLYREYRIINLMGKKKFLDIFLPTKEDFLVAKRAKDLVLAKITSLR